MVDKENVAEVEQPESEMTLREMCFEIALAALQCNHPKALSLTELIQDFARGLASAESMTSQEVNAVISEDKTELNAETAIQEDYVVCLECGFHAKQLTNKHMAIHDMTINEYKEKWGYKKGTKLVCLK